MECFKLKKAAMFGLDARIALVIFAALSVISGAALYSSIQNINMVKVINTMESMSKGVEHYVLTTGNDFEQNSVWVNNHRAIQLVENYFSDPEWDGPYVDNMSPRTDVASYNAKYQDSICNSISCRWSIVNMTAGPLGGYTSTHRFSPCVIGTGCSYYMSTEVANFSFLDSSNLSAQLEFIEKLDEEIDNGDGYKIGKFRWLFYYGTKYIIFYQGSNMLNSTAVS